MCRQSKSPHWLQKRSHVCGTEYYETSHHSYNKNIWGKGWRFGLILVPNHLNPEWLKVAPIPIEHFCPYLNLVPLPVYVFSCSAALSEFCGMPVKRVNDEVSAIKTAWWSMWGQLFRPKSKDTSLLEVLLPSGNLRPSEAKHPCSQAYSHIRVCAKQQVIHLLWGCLNLSNDDFYATNVAFSLNNCNKAQWLAVITKAAATARSLFPCPVPISSCTRHPS